MEQGRKFNSYFPEAVEGKNRGNQRKVIFKDYGLTFQKYVNHEYSE